MKCHVYRKVTPTLARVLTKQDYEAYQGVIQTHEGPRTFLPGDYLAKDVLGIWPMKSEHIRTNYEQCGPANGEGFFAFFSKEVRQAVQMNIGFTVDGLEGKPGDYLVFGQWSAWPVAKQVFEQIYTLIEA